MSSLVTFVFSDLVGSVDLKRRMPGAGATERDQAYVERVLTPHRERIEQGLTEARGRVVSTAGDGHFLAFTDTIQAARWAINVQRSHEEDPIAVPGGSATARVRIGMHVGPPQVDPNDSHNFIGRAVDYAARLADRAVAGQVLLSRSAASLLEDAGLDGVRIHSHGPMTLRGIGEVEVHEALYAGRPPVKPRRDSGDEDRREWTVLPATMGLTEYAAQSSHGSANSSSVTAMATAPVEKVGNYELQEIIGAGGMGNVYRARHALFGRTRAVKIIKPELVAAGGESVVRRFYQEIQATGALEHPNLVVAIESSAPEDDLHFLVMEYVEGIGVDQLINEQGALKVADACEIARQAALGLDHLHTQGLVHRDVKPSNVMLTVIDNQSATPTPVGSASAPQRVAVAKLMDLGLALLVRDDQQRLTRMDQGGMGTGHYMSPEQWKSTTVDIRADIYSLGCTLFHLLHGQPPYADSDLRPEKAHEREPVPTLRADLPPKLAELLRRMMAKRPEERPASPLEVAQALAPFCEGHGLAQVLGRRSGLGEARLAKGSKYDTLGTGQEELDTRVPRRINVPEASPYESPSTVDPARRRVLWVVSAVACIAAIGLGWMAKNLHERNVERRTHGLVKTANLTSKVMAEQINKRFAALQEKSKQPELREWLQQLNATPEDTALRVDMQRWIVNEKSQRDSEFLSNSWFLTDARGLQVARAPASETIGNSYAHRDYFHGRGKDLDEAAAAETPPPAIRTPHQSSVYESTSTHRLKVAFSVPVWNKSSGSDRVVIGVLAMSVELGDFTALAEAEEDVLPTEIVLADSGYDYIQQDDSGQPLARRGLILHHRDLKQYNANHPRLDESILAVIDGQDQIGSARQLPNYRDLLGRSGARYHGVYAPIVIRNPGRTTDTGWIIIAQEPAQ